MRMPVRILVPLCLIVLAGLQAMCGSEKVSGPSNVPGAPTQTVGATAVGLWRVPYPFSQGPSDGGQKWLVQAMICPELSQMQLTQHCEQSA